MKTFCKKTVGRSPEASRWGFAGRKSADASLHAKEIGAVDIW